MNDLRVLIREAKGKMRTPREEGAALEIATMIGLRFLKTSRFNDIVI